jgi:hypothetical protein
VNNSAFFQTTGLMALVILTTVVLTSCSNQPLKNKAPSTTAPSNPTVETQIITATDLVNQATNETPEIALQTLISASKQFITEKDYVKALWLAKQTSLLTNQADTLYDITLVKAKSLFLLNKIDLATQQLTTADNFHVDNDITHNVFYYELLSQVEASRNLPVAAIEAKLYALSLGHPIPREPSLKEPSLRQLSLDPSTLDELNDTELNNSNIVDANQALWQQLISLSDWQVNLLVKRDPPQIKGWQQLLYYAHKFGDKQQTFNRYLSQWQRNYPTHPAQSVASELQQNTENNLLIMKNIAVILPLSGQHSMVGKSAQQGILAAYDNDESKTLHFIDSSQLDMASLNTFFETAAIDQVIGPLLRPKVNEYVNQTTIEVPTLLLNIPLDEALPAHCVALSMRPEDEAKQAASALSSQGYTQPIVFSHLDNVSQRMASAFTEQWQKILDQTPDIVYFDKQQNVQDQLKQSLEVHLSESRIKDLQIRVEQPIKTEPRSRRDLDMVYLIGSSNETRLLKPYIDVNTSPFADVIPIFASSRSHSDKSIERDSQDLEGLVFTQMPWLLTSDQQNKALKQLNKQLWPNKSDGLQRIFAMGYDSFSMLEKINKMKRYAYIRHYGQTGILQLNANNLITRTLLWGIYQQDKVAKFAME